MKFLFNRLLSRPPVFAAIGFASLVINLLALASPLFVMQVLNRYVSHGVDATLLTLAVAAVFAVIMEFGFRQIRLHFAAAIAMRPDEEIALQNHHLMASINQNALQQTPSGVRRQFLNSADALEKLTAAPNIATVMDLPFAALFLGVLAMLSPTLALVAMFFIAVSSLLAWLVSRKVQDTTSSLFKEKAVGNHHANSLLNASDEVRVFRARQFIMHRCQLHLRQAQDMTRRIAFHRGTSQSVTQSATAMMSIAIIAIAAIMVVHGSLDVGIMIGANILASRASAAVSKFTSMGEAFAMANQSLETSRKFRNMPTEMVTGAALQAYQGHFELQDVAYTHSNAQSPLFESLSLKMPAGTILLLTGANGTGKTTFCRMILGLVEPQRGSILADGVEMKQIVPNWWRSQICYVPQDSKFINATVRENLSTMNAEIEDEELAEILREAGLWTFISESAEGMDRPIEDNGRDLSAGIRRRLTLARGLTSKCNLIVLDEPTEALDIDGRKTVHALFDKFVKQGKTMIVVSTDPQLVSKAHLVLDLNAKPVPKILTPNAPKRGKIPKGGGSHSGSPAAGGVRPVLVESSDGVKP